MMVIKFKIAILLFLVITLEVSGMNYCRNMAVDNANRHAHDKPKYPADCARYVSSNIIYGLGGQPFSFGKRLSGDDWNKRKSTHKNQKYWFDEEGCAPWAQHLCDFFTDVLDCDYTEWESGDRPTEPPEASEIRPGDIAFYFDRVTNSYPSHAVIITKVESDKITYAAHSDNKLNRGTNIGDLLKMRPERKLKIVHIPDVIMGCRIPVYWYANDSTFGFLYYLTHQYICCWHENLGTQWPWTSNPTAYACLSWEETRGTTWDTLISPRINLAGCSSVVFRQSSYSNLLHGSNKVIEVRYSIDDGTNWSYCIGNDTTKEASMPCATNQRNVRIAWIYKGQVQAARYWCVDDIEILAKPSREHDICVSEIRCPKGRGGINTIITQGKIIKPKAYVWNFGKDDESLSVTYKIGSSYSDTKTIKLYPYNDTLLEFSPWTATPGNYTATCYSNLSGDEFRSNDTATLNFIVAADTWISMFPVYNRGVSTGACITSTGNETLYCVTGKQHFFANYLISQNLWKTRRPTIKNFAGGGCITYANDDYLYALRGGLEKTFYRYRISNNTWTTIANAPNKISKGAAIAYGGGNYIYALRGYRKKSFYRYNISSNSWSSLADAPDKIQEGGSLVWTGGDFLYALRGDEETDFYRYQISTNQWTSKASIPSAVGNGGSLAYDSLTNKIYAFCGDRTSSFYVYNISNNTWSSRNQTPHPVKNYACLTYADNSIYGILGRSYDKDFWRYSPPAGGDFDEAGEGENENQTLDMIRYEPNGWLDKGPEELLTFDPKDKYKPRYSPDGDWIGYAAEDASSECISLYKIGPDGGEPFALSKDTTSYENLMWSADGDWLVASSEEGIYKISSDGTTKELIIEGIASNPRWSANDDWIVYEKWGNANGDATHNIYKVRPDGTDETCLLLSADEYLQPQPISDSEIVCVKLKGEVYQIYKIANGQETQLTSDYCDNMNPSLSVDGDWITYQKLDESGYWQIYKMRTNGEEETKLTNDECNYETPIFSSDGEWIAYSKWPKDTCGSYEYSQICYITKDGGGETALNDPDAVRENPCWSPDNAYIIYEKITDDASCGEGRKKHKQICRVRTNLKYIESLEDLVGKLPKVFALYQNRPNPFRTKTNIRYAIPIECQVELDIFDLTGRNVKTLINDLQKPNYYTVRWDGKDNQGKKVAQGVYFYTLRADKKIRQKKMLLLK